MEHPQPRLLWASKCWPQLRPTRCCAPRWELLQVPDLGSWRRACLPRALCSRSPHSRCWPAWLLMPPPQVSQTAWGTGGVSASSHSALALGWGPWARVCSRSRPAPFGSPDFLWGDQVACEGQAQWSVQWPTAPQQGSGAEHTHCPHCLVTRPLVHACGPEALSPPPGTGLSPGLRAPEHPRGCTWPRPPTMSAVLRSHQQTHSQAWGKGHVLAWPRAQAEDWRTRRVPWGGPSSWEARAAEQWRPDKWRRPAAGACAGQPGAAEVDFGAEAMGEGSPPLMLASCPGDWRGVGGVAPPRCQPQWTTPLGSPAPFPVLLHLRKCHLPDPGAAHSMAGTRPSAVPWGPGSGWVYTSKRVGLPSLGQGQQAQGAHRPLGLAATPFEPCL